MGLKQTIKKAIESTGYTVRKATPYLDLAPDSFNEDGLYTVHAHDFATDPRFIHAYERGIAAEKTDPQWRWRVHIGLWAASTASKLPGEFVECGTNYGFLASAIMDHLNWNSVGKIFFLMDTFQGVDARFVDDAEREHHERNAVPGYYATNLDAVKANFAEWKNVKFIAGAIPETLAQVPDIRVAYLHIDMNNAAPEVAALEFFWDKLVPGAVVLLDDYAYRGRPVQKAAMDGVAKAKGVAVATLPTGQGLLLKPPN